MIKYNDNNIIVGYIKELLHTTYLPTAKVYKSDETCYNGGIYVKNNGIYQFLNGKLNLISPFKFNIRFENFTKVLKVENSLYDSHTHEYLGEYLRFFRDYFHLNLMSLYNCFSAKMPENMTISMKNSDNTEEILYTSDDENYKYYIVPVKFNSVYTVYIDSTDKVELTTILYDKGYYQIKNSLDDLVIAGKQVETSPSFNQPIKYKFLNKLNKFDEYYQFESDLKLLIKIPFNCNSSIVILEDDYSTTNEMIDLGDKAKNRQSYFDLKSPKTEINYEYVDKLDEIPLASRSQLTYMNTKVSHPFADRLLEYLTENAITHLETISDNIARVQHELNNRDEEDVSLPYINLEGIWDKSYKPLLYRLAEKEHLLDTKFDILGYVDKDVELKLGEDYDLYRSNWYEEE